MKNNKINFIAEISSNHNKNLKRTLNMIDSAKKVDLIQLNFSYLKLKNYLLKKFWITPKNTKRSKWELPIEFIPKISSHCKREK